MFEILVEKQTMSVVTIDPTVDCTRLKALEALSRVMRAPDFFTNSGDKFAQYVVDRIIRASATNSSISAQATLVISQAHMGVALFSQQTETSRQLAAFVYKLMVPDGAVPTEARFCRRYRITDQREAHEGTYDTVGNSVQSKDYSQVFQLTSKVVTMQFGSVLKITVPSVARELIARELDRVGVSWELTKTIEVLRYCTAQPTLSDRVIHRTKSANRADKLDSVLVVTELTCGMINVQPAAFTCALENARRVLGSNKPEVVVLGDSLYRVVSQRSVADGAWAQIVREESTVTPEVVVYTAANEIDRQGGCYEFTMRERTTADPDLAFMRAESSSAVKMPIKYVRLGGGSEHMIPIVHVDAVQMEHGVQRDTSTEHKAFSNADGFKWEYFTVGCTPPALNQINPYNILSTTESDELNYRQLALRSPCVSYLHQYNGAVVGVTLRELHALAHPPELFTRQRRERLQHDVDALMRGNAGLITAEKLAQLGHCRGWYDKTGNPACVLEFDSRNMVVPRAKPGADPAAIAVDRWVVRPRVALFNSSTMNSIENEIAQIGSELLVHFGDTEMGRRLSEDTLPFLEEALMYTRGAEPMLALRGEVLAGGDPVLQSGWSKKGRLFWAWLADPVCTVHIRNTLVEKETDDGGLSAEERRVMITAENMINDVTEVFRLILGDRRNSAVASLPMFCTGARGTHAYPKNFTVNDVDYCNVMYWLILPCLGARVYRARGTIGDAQATVSAELQYKDGDVNLTNEFQLPAGAGFTIARLSGDCFFSRRAPGNGAEDVSHIFEPLAAKHKTFADVGFSETSLVTYAWAIRVQKVSQIANVLAKVLMGIHYSTLMTRSVILEHYDEIYYSGMSYLLFRGVRFTGCGASLMQQKSALYTLGANIVCTPTAHNTHQVYTVNQCCQSAVIPDTLESPGVYVPNLFMKDVRGGEVHLGGGGPFDMVVADAFNGFCPDSDSASGYRRPYIFTTGRSERLLNNGAIALDPLTRVPSYSCMPTLLRPLSSTLASKRAKRSAHRGNERSNYRIFCDDILHVVEFERGVLDPIGDPFKDTVERANGDKRTTDLMQPSLGVAFCGTYSIGLTSDKKLLTWGKDETLADRLAPRISGTGFFSCSPVPVTSRIITPVFNKIFDTSSYTRVVQC